MAMLMTFDCSILYAEEESDVVAAISLAELAASADTIVLAQVRDTDYLYRRDFPVEGSAFLKVLIPYKLDQNPDIIEVFEQGMHSNECYFQNPTVFEEGRRYLLFLRRDTEKPERFRGLAQGCALDVLVDRDNRYVLRLPITGIDLSDSLAELGSTYDFTDAYAVENDETLKPAQREELLSGGWIRAEEESYIYTSGIELSVIRRLMGPDGVSSEHHYGN